MDRSGKSSHDCNNDLPPFEMTECGPELPCKATYMDEIALRKAVRYGKIEKKPEENNSRPNRKQRRRKRKTFKPGMMRGNNFTPAKRKRR